jgi:predicted NBD/HSP70 family sugar kinase
VTIHSAPGQDQGGSKRALLLEVLRHGPLSRSQLAERLGLSPPTLTRLCTPLIEAGLFQETEVLRGKRSGRPSRPIDVVPDAAHFVGVKLTADEAHGVLTNLRAELRGRAHLPLTDTDPSAVAAVVADLVHGLSAPVSSVTSLGVSLGGDAPDHRTVRHAPFLGWDDVPLSDLLEEATGLTTILDNDLVALARAEHWFGSARDSRHFAVITLGAGTGFGLVVHDQVVESPDAGVGLLGHFPLDPLGPRCLEGHRGCAATMLSIPGISGAVSVAMGRRVDYAECLELARDGHPVAGAVVRDAARALGSLVAEVCNISMSNDVVLTGEGIGLAEVARAELDEALRKGRDPRASEVRLLVQGLDFSQWARGAAVCAIQSWVPSANGW